MDKTKFWTNLKSGEFASMVKESSYGETASSPKEIFNIMKPLFAEKDDVEVMYCLFFNAKNKILAIEKMFSGSINSSAVYPREIIKKSLELKATCLVMVHNHPSGNTNPSREDYAITAKVFVALESISMSLHDHIIIGENFFSLAEHGYLESIKLNTQKFYRTVQCM